MKITLDTTNLRPATMAVMIADLFDMEPVDAGTISTLVAAIEDSVGIDMAIEFLADAGITPEQLEWHAVI